MNIKYKQYNVLYKEYINDFSIIDIIIHSHLELCIFQLDKLDIQVFINIFTKYYSQYQSNIMQSFAEFVFKNDYMICSTKSGKYYLNNNNYLMSIQDILNHYNKICEVIKEYKEYLIIKYPKPIKKKPKVYHHIKKLI